MTAFILVSDPCKSRGEPNPSAGVILLTKTESSNSGKYFLLSDQNTDRAGSTPMVCIYDDEYGYCICIVSRFRSKGLINIVHCL